jgi:hypothetical protein
MRVMLIRVRDHGFLRRGALLISLFACRVKMPATPEELAPRTFALTLNGTFGTAALQTNETFGGTACRVGEYILLLNPSRKLTITFPSIPDHSERYALGMRDESNKAYAFLNVPNDINRGMSLTILDGRVSVVGPSPADAAGVIDGRLAQAFLDKTPAIQNATVHGVFRAGKCAYSREGGYRAP